MREKMLLLLLQLLRLLMVTKITYRCLIGKFYQLKDYEGAEEGPID